MHIRRWIIAAGILGAVTLVLLGTIIALSGDWLRVVAVLAVLAGIGALTAAATGMVADALRATYWRGYGTGSQDALDPDLTLSDSELSDMIR